MLVEIDLLICLFFFLCVLTIFVRPSDSQLFHWLMMQYAKTTSEQLPADLVLKVRVEVSVEPPFRPVTVTDVVRPGDQLPCSARTCHFEHVEHINEAAVSGSRFSSGFSL